MDVIQVILAFVPVMTGALVQGITGLGLNLFAAPLLVLVNPALVPGPVMAGALALTLLMSLRDRSGIDLRGVAWMVAGMLPGVVLGSLLLPVLPPRTLALVLGGLVLAGVGLSLSGLRFPSHGWVLALAGFVSGAGGTLASIGGPPVALVNQEMEAKRLRATLSTYFLILGVVSIIGQAAAGRFGAAEVQLTGVAILPGVVLGFLASFPLAKRLTQRGSRIAILVLSGASAVILIVQKLIS